MAINLKNFVNIKITQHISSVTTSERDTAVLVWVGTQAFDHVYDTVNSATVTESFGSGTVDNNYIILSNSSDATVENIAVREHNTGASYALTVVENAYNYIKMFFDNNGKKLRFVGVIKDSSDTTGVNSFKSVVDALEMEHVVVATNLVNTVITSFLTTATINNDKYYARANGTQQKIFLSSIYGTTSTITDVPEIPFYILKFGVPGIEMSIAAYLTNVNVDNSSTTSDYSFTSESVPTTSIDASEVSITTTTETKTVSGMQLYFTDNTYGTVAFNTSKYSTTGNITYTKPDSATSTSGTETSSSASSTSTVLENVPLYFVDNTYSEKNSTSSEILPSMSITPYSVTDAVLTYTITVDSQTSGSEVTRTNVVDDDALVSYLLAKNINVEGSLVGSVRNLGGNDTNGNALMNQYMLILLHQTLTEKLVQLLVQKIKYNSTSLSLIGGVINQELRRYVSNGYLSTDKIWTDNSLIYNGYTIISKNTPLNNGYLYYILPLTTLTDEQRKEHCLPDIYVLISDGIAIRKINITGEVF